MAAYARATTLKAQVPTTVVDPVVTEYPLTAPAGARIAPGALAVSSRRTTGGSDVVTSEPQPVTGYGAVGVTWAGTSAALPEGDIAVEVRTKDGAGWSGWTEAHYSDEHGPDPDSAEGLSARPGTDELLVGDVDEVQVRVDTEGSAPTDLKLAVIDPGAPVATERESAAIDTATLPSADTAPRRLPPPQRARLGPRPGRGRRGRLALAAAAYTPKPKIFSRAQWGADESMRDPGSLRYFEVHAGFVHHTVNANDYSKADVPAILRSIYAYHTQARGWSDIGYNFLVDRFGRVWEGRYGGVDRPVVGAHTLGYNDDSFAMSAIGNFEEAQPSQAMIEAYGAVFAWKLSLHGVKAGSMRQYVTSRTFPAINGHRDAGSTACPGKYLYAKIPRDPHASPSRHRSGSPAASWSRTSRPATSPTSSCAAPATGGRCWSRSRPRRAATTAGKPVPLAMNLDDASRILNAGDWNRDGHGDLITRRKSDGRAVPAAGPGQRHVPARSSRSPTASSGVKLLAAVGDMTGDG